NKPIFIDVYTEWCGPCKWMDQNVFNQKEVGDYMNKNFISVKLDAEKGFGKAFAKAYHIGSYPTYVYFNQNGDVVLTTSGSLDIDKFLHLSKKALDNIEKQINLHQLKSKIA